jgi:tRNA (uracil-5-)-methyltransferase
VEPARYGALLDDKVAAVRHLLAPLAPPSPEVFASPPLAFRLRAEFRFWHDGDDAYYAMFDPAAPRDPIRVDEFPIACTAIQELMEPLRQYLRSRGPLREKLFQVEFLSTLAGDTLLTLVYHRRLDEEWEHAAIALAEQFDVAVVGRSRRQKCVVRRDYVTEVLTVEGRSLRYRQHEQAFAQPNGAVNLAMLHWACGAAASLSGDLIELYCGNGNFTLPLARHFAAVIATELAKTAVADARHNLAANGIGNVAVLRMSAEEVSAALGGERTFRRLAALPQPLSDYDLRTVFVDPPRAGLDSVTLDAVRRFDNILYVSCNPQTLRDNLSALADRYRIARFGLFDQFPYTEHMECGVLLVRR